MHISDKFIRNVKKEYMVSLKTYIKISRICNNNTANHLTFGWQWSGLTLRVNP